MERIIDASDQTLGRLSSRIAKDLINGKKIIVINAENTIITGSPKNIIEKFKTRIDVFKQKIADSKTEEAKNIEDLKTRDESPLLIP